MTARRPRAPIWLTTRLVLAIHGLLITRYGGPAGVRDRGLLESALARPLNLRAYAKPDLPALAAAYARGIVDNHPFVDGNKRTGFLAAATFLDRNGLELTAPEAEATRMTVELAASRVTEDDYAAWIREHTRSRTSRRTRRKRR